MAFSGLTDIHLQWLISLHSVSPFSSYNKYIVVVIHKDKIESTRCHNRAAVKSGVVITTRCRFVPHRMSETWKLMIDVAVIWVYTSWTTKRHVDILSAHSREREKNKQSPHIFRTFCFGWFHWNQSNTP